MKDDLSQELENNAIESLRRVYRKKILARIVEGIAACLSVLLLSLFLTGLLEMIFNFGPLIRTSLFLISGAALLITFSKLLLPYLLHYFRSVPANDLVETALEVGETFPEIKDRLRNAIELMSPGHESFHSDELVKAYIERTISSASPGEIEAAVRYKPRKKSGYILAATLTIAALLLISFPSSMPTALIHSINFTRDYVTPSAYSFYIAPGDTEISRGDTLDVHVKVNLITAAHFPSVLTVSEKYSDEKVFEKHQVKEKGNGDYFFRLPDVRGNLAYYVTASGQRSRDYSVNVVDLPIVRDFTVRLVYPQYTNRPPETLQEDIGDFSALIGTRAEYSLRSNKPLIEAWIAFGDSSANVKLETSGTEAHGSFILRHTSHYMLRLLDHDSLENRDPIAYTASAISDQYPTCEITSPGKDVVLNRDMILPLRISIGDDYGFTRLLLQYKLVSSKYVSPEKKYRSIEIPLPSKSAGQEDVTYIWDLSSRNLVPEDVISYHATVFDNDMVDGPKSTSSTEYTLRLPSLEEVFAAADSEHSGLIQKTEDALNSSDNLKQQLDKISEEMKTATKQLSWEQQKKMGNTLQQYDSLQKKVEGIRKQIEKMTQKMLQNKIISPKTLEKYQELQKALQDINSPEFQEALKKLQQAIQSLNPNMVREAMKNFQINDEMLRKSIERTLSLIKRIQIEQKFDELQTRVDQLLSGQEEVQKSTASSDSTNRQTRRQLSQSQQEIHKEFSSVEHATSDLNKMMSEISKDMPIKQLSEANEALRKSAVSEKMEAASRELSRGQFSSSLANQQDVSSALQKFKQQLSAAEKSMLQNRQQATINALRKTQQNLLEISKEQEALRDRSTNIIPNSAESRSLSAKQNELMQQLGYSAQQMMQLSNKSFAVTPQMGRQMGEAYSQMQKSLNALQSRGGQSPTNSQSEAMASLNKAVLNIQATLQSMMQGQGGGSPSLLQQLEQLGANQEGLNALTRQLGMQGALSMQQQAELARLAARQEAIRKSLEQLAHEAQSSQSQERVLGNLNDIAKEMSRVAIDMHDKNITSETIQRQDRILRHLLDASRSFLTQNYDNRRVTKAGKDVITQSPGPLKLSDKQLEEEQRLLKLIRENFPPEYQRVILKYYHLLQKARD